MPDTDHHHTTRDRSCCLRRDQTVHCDVVASRWAAKISFTISSKLAARDKEKNIAKVDGEAHEIHKLYEAGLKVEQMKGKNTAHAPQSTPIGRHNIYRA